MQKRLLLFLAFWCWVTFASHAQKSQPPKAMPKPMIGAEVNQAEKWMKETGYGFTENKGQLTDQHGKQNKTVKYLLNMPGLKVQLRQTGFSYDTYVVKGKGDSKKEKFHRVDIELEGANAHAAITTASQAGPGQNVINGTGEFYNIRQFQKVMYRDIYPGIDLEFMARKGTDKPVEYNFIVRPGADASLIKLRYKGANEMALKVGRIVMSLNHGKLSENIPASWLSQTRKPVKVDYKALEKDIYAFNVPVYDKSKTLVIDPTPNLEWASYYGGSDSDLIQGINTDPAGNIYVTGSTRSSNNIASSGAYDGIFGGGDNGLTPPVINEDIFVVKFNSAGQRVWSTYYGGTGIDIAYGITFHNGQIYVGGTSGSENLATQGAHQVSPGNQTASLLARFDAATGQRTWATYYGGVNRAGFFAALRLDANGNIFALGGSVVNLYPENSSTTGDVATSGAFRQNGGASTGYLVKFNAAGVRQWGTFLAGSDLKSIEAKTGSSMELDASGNVYIAGSGANATYDVNLPANVGEGTVVTTDRGYLAKFASSNGERLWGRFFDGSFSDLQLDEASGRIQAIGSTTSSTGVASPGAYRTSLASTRDGFWASFDLGGHFIKGTYLGGQSGLTYAQNSRLDGSGDLIILGSSSTSGGELASDCSYQPIPGGGQDIFVNKFNLASGQRTWGTYLGGAGDDLAGFIKGAFGCFAGSSNLTVTGDGKIIVGGYVQPGSGNLATSGSHQLTYGGGDFDGILAKFNSGALPADFAVSATSLTPMAQNACISGMPALITGNAVGVTAPAGYFGKLFYQWQKSASVSGPWEDIPGEVYKDLQPSASQTTLYYRRQVKVNTELCNQTVVSTSQVTSVIIGTNTAPIANADGPEWYVCASPNNTVALNGSASGGTGAYTYQWFAGSSATAAVTAPAYSPSVTSATTYTLKVTDAAGCVDIDQVTVTPVVAAAGNDKSNCAGAGVQIGTMPVSNPGISYAWTLVNGGSATATLSCTSCAQPVATPTMATTYRLTVTVSRKGSGTCSSFDDVLVTPVAAPTGGATTFAGSDKTICKNETVVLGGTADAAATYTWTSGQYLSASQVPNPTFQAGTAEVSCPITYTVTAVKNGCAFVDEVNVTTINKEITEQNEIHCGPIWITQLNEANCDGATYTWNLISGNGVVLETRNGGADAYLFSTAGNAVFSRTTTINGVSCTSDQTTITNVCNNCETEIIMIGEQGCPKVFGSAPSFQLTTGYPASDYNFTWSPANMVDNPNAAVVTVTSAANSTITVVITNKYDASITCSKSILVNDPLWALPVFDAADKFTCPQTPITIGAVNIAGFSYAWTPAAGLSSTTISKPVATLPATTAFKVLVTETATGCKSVNNLTVNVADVTANAGNDRTVCNGGTYTLGNPAPAGTNWTYAWAPVNAAWAPGSGPADAQPQVVFAGASQTFTLTVTDLVSGCSKTDQVTLRSVIAAGEYAGTAVTACPGETIQLGREAEPFATYQWFMADGITPATGLSSNTAANPTLTAPNVTTTFKVRITYPGCTLPADDQVTVTVKTAPAIALNDVVYCPTTATAIGFGANGNAAAPAGITSYLWSPATGLSDATIANPVTSVNVVTTYNLTVAYANGCIRTDELKVTPAAIANAGPDLTICAGESVVLGSAAITGATYLWSGTGITSGGTSAQPTVKPAVTTTYTVTVTANGCTTTNQVTVTVNTPADFALTGNTSICAGSVATVGLSGTAAANTSWQWSPLAGVASPNSLNTTIAATGTTTYRLTQTNLTTGCSNYKEVVVVSRANTIQATAADAATCPDVALSLPLNVTSTGNYSYVWSPSAGLSNAFIANPVVSTNTARTYTVTITDNVSNCQLIKTVNVSINPVEACYPAVTLTGNVFHDANALKDVTVNTTSADPIPTGLYVTLVDQSGGAVKTVAVNANGSYDFGITPPGNYSVVLNQTPGGSTTPSLPAGWINTGENLGAGVGSDDSDGGILTGVTVAGTNVTNANFGVQQPPVTIDKALPSAPNPGGIATVDISNDFIKSDPDGTLTTITFTAFPANVTTVSINGQVYVPVGVTPAAGQLVWPATVTVPVTSLTVLIDPADGAVTTSVPFKVTDNGGAESNVSAVTKPFTLPTVMLSGNVFHDANGLTDNTVNTSGPVTSIPAGLYVSLLDNLGAIVKTVPVNADGSYDFGTTDPATYSVVLHQTAAGSVTPSLPATWKNTGEHLGINTGSDGTVNGILTNVIVTTTDVTNANLGIQQPPVAQPKEYVIDQPASEQVITLDGTHLSTGPGTTSPAQMTGTDPEDGTLNGNNKDRTVVITTLPDHGELYYKGILVTQGQVIEDYDPSLATVKLIGTGYSSITYQYAYADQAGAVSPAVTYKISWGSPLPVTLISFEAKAQENTAALSWSTSAETNSDRFEVQRSSDARTWSPLADVSAKGESKAVEKYSYADQKPAAGQNLYRLKMIDRDGSFAYSRIASVNFDFKFETAIYPNPVSETLSLKVTDWEKVKNVRIDNLKGIQVYSSGPVTSGTLGVKHLPEGIYILRITNKDGSVYTHKLVHIK